MKKSVSSPRVWPLKHQADLEKIDRRAALLQQELQSLQLVRENVALRAALDIGGMTSADFDASEITRAGAGIIFQKKPAH